MTPALWVGSVFVLLVIVAGAAEVYAYRSRRRNLRSRILHEYSSSVRDYERLRRAQLILDARQRRVERRLTLSASQPAPPAPIPIPAPSAETSPPPVVVDPIGSDIAVGD